MADDPNSPTEVKENTLPDTTVVVEPPVIPEPSDTTVVVEPDTSTTDPNDALDFSERVNRIVDERVSQRIMSLEERLASMAPPEPQVVVVAPEPAPAPAPAPPAEPVPDKAPDPTPDEPPPNDHWYFRNRRGKKRG